MFSKAFVIVSLAICWSWWAWRLSYSMAGHWKYFSRRSAASTVTARLPFTISLMRRGGTPISFATRYSDKPRGRRKSSRKISQGWMGGTCFHGYLFPCDYAMWGRRIECLEIFSVMLNKSALGGVKACVTENYETMKKLITAIAIGALTFAGTAIKAEARPWYERGQPGPNYGNNYSQGCSTYTERYIAGYDYHGHPIYRYRTVSVPSRNQYSNHDRGYDRGYSRDYQNSHYDNRRSSGASVNFSFGRR